MDVPCVPSWLALLWLFAPPTDSRRMYFVYYYVNALHLLMIIEETLTMGSAKSQSENGTLCHENIILFPSNAEVLILAGNMGL